MKTIASELAYFLRGRAQKNLKVLFAYCAFLVILVLIYAVLFRVLMWNLEGREFSFIAGVYWAITVMTTLGFGDITFHSDLGYIFATVVTISGVIFLLIILPFGLISLFLAPWIEDRLRHQATYELPEGTSGHVVIFGMDAITRAFIRKLQIRGISFVVVTPDYDEAARLEEDEGLHVIHGSPTDIEVIAAVRTDSARYVIVNLSDPENVNICLTVRSHCQTPIATLVDDPEHAGLLRLAGANQVIPLHKILGRYLAVRSTTCGAMAHVLDSFGDLKIAEIPVHGTPFSGHTLQEAQIRQRTGLGVIGIWERGVLTMPTRDTVLADKALMVLAGTREQLKALELLAGEKEEEDLIFILGHGRIGCAAAHFLEHKPVPFILVDREENPSCTEHIPIYGDATVRNTLMGAGLDRAKGVIVTTNDDNTNVFLTLASRDMQPHVRIVARANSEKNVDQLYAAGADFVVSNASVGANILLNVLESKASAFLTEGINVFRRSLSKSLAGQTIAGSHIRVRTGCSIVALTLPGESDSKVSPPPETLLEAGSVMILIGTPKQEEVFDTVFMNES
ncbi:MAG: potassium transporter TrkA [Deltaproteobacteria bacterium]|nr:MAG: potassium transporter TrkA [Deltaproteobacteria bacterium]